MENKRLTKKDKFAMIREYVLDNTMLVEFIDNEIYLLSKKASSSVTKTQVENKNIKDRIYALLVENSNRQFTITEFQKEFEEFGVDKYSNQKLSALFTQLKEEGKVERIPDKKKSYFKASV